MACNYRAMLQRRLLSLLRMGTTAVFLPSAHCRPLEIWAWCCSRHRDSKSCKVRITQACWCSDDFKKERKVAGIHVLEVRNLQFCLIHRESSQNNAWQKKTSQSTSSQQYFTLCVNSPSLHLNPYQAHTGSLSPKSGPYRWHLSPLSKFRQHDLEQKYLQSWDSFTVKWPLLKLNGQLRLCGDNKDPLIVSRVSGHNHSTGLLGQCSECLLWNASVSN